MAKKFPKVTFQEVRPKVKIKQDIINFFENELPTLPIDEFIKLKTLIKKIIIYTLNGIKN